MIPLIPVIIGGLTGFALSGSKKFKSGGSVINYNDECLMKVITMATNTSPVESYYINDNKLVLIFRKELTFHDIDTVNCLLTKIKGCNDIFQDHFEIGYKEEFRTLLLPLYTNNFSIGKFDKGGIINQYEGLSPEQVWAKWDGTQRVHFLHDHNLKEIHNSKVMDYSFDELPISIRTAIRFHVIGGQYEKGGEIGILQDIKKFEDGGEIDIEKEAEFYFSDKYNLTKHQLREDLVRHIKTNNDLIKGKIRPSDVVGSGYKNPAPIAKSWLKHQIQLTKYLLENFDEKNQLTESQKKELAEKDAPKVSIAQVKKFLPKTQWFILENDEFVDVVENLKKVIAKLPKTYETDNIKSPEKVAMLHYFYGNLDWYVVERDMEDEQLQAYGYVDLGGGGEWGYINVQELVNSPKVELDLYFEPTQFKNLDL